MSNGACPPTAWPLRGMPAAFSLRVNPIFGLLHNFFLENVYETINDPVSGQVCCYLPGRWRCPCPRLRACAEAAYRRGYDEDATDAQYSNREILRGSAACLYCRAFLVWVALKSDVNAVSRSCRLTDITDRPTKVSGSQRCLFHTLGSL